MVTISGHLIKKKILYKTEFPSGRIYGFDLFPKINLLAAKFILLKQATFLIFRREAL